MKPALVPDWRFPGVPGLLPTLALTALVYLPSLTDRFLSFDDDWLILENEILQGSLERALPSVLWGLDFATRDALGSEYLPVRDLFVWLELHLFGVDAFAMRVTSLSLYLSFLFVLDRCLSSILPDRPRVTRVALALFALHPVHAESVGWLASQKELLSVLFSACALWAYVVARPRWLWLVPSFALLACFSKSIAVVLPLLLWLCVERANPKLARTTGRLVALAATTLACGAASFVHYWVGQSVEMMTPTLGGSRLVATLTMGQVLLRYVGMSLAPVELSVVYEQEPAHLSDPIPWLAAAFVVLLVVSALGAYRSKQTDWRRDFWFASGWFLIPLLPVSQVVVPLPNVITDRYLILSVLGPCLGLAWFVEGRSSLFRNLAATALCAFFGILSWQRAGLFGDPVRLFSDATMKTRTRAVAPYQLGIAHAAAGRLAESESAYRLAIGRGESSITHCKASNNLAHLLVSQARQREALSLLREQQHPCRDNPKTLTNLAELLARSGRHAEAKGLLEDILHRFPDHERARQAYERHYGVP